MLAVHYELTLPADYDMEIIRDRVRQRGSATDAWPDLGFKAYLIREAGDGWSTVNQYAPFYLWNDTPGFNTFMFEGGFGNIIRDFGRPPAQQWTGLAFERGPTFDEPPVAATRDITSIPSDLNPAAGIAHHIGEAGALITSPLVHSVALAIDTRIWQIVRFTLWREPAPHEATGARFQVAHLSSPGLANIPQGRHW